MFAPIRTTNGALFHAAVALVLADELQPVCERVLNIAANSLDSSIFSLRGFS